MNWFWRLVAGRKLNRMLDAWVEETNAPDKLDVDAIRERYLEQLRRTAQLEAKLTDPIPGAFRVDEDSGGENGEGGSEGRPGQEGQP